MSTGLLGSHCNSTGVIKIAKYASISEENSLWDVMCPFFLNFDLFLFLIFKYYISCRLGLIGERMIYIYIYILIDRKLIYDKLLLAFKHTQLNYFILNEFSSND
jgi:hypothetical protein